MINLHQMYKGNISPFSFFFHFFFNLHHSKGGNYRVQKPGAYGWQVYTQGKRYRKNRNITQRRIHLISLMSRNTPYNIFFLPRFIRILSLYLDNLQVYLFKSFVLVSILVFDLDCVEVFKQIQFFQAY